MVRKFLCRLSELKDGEPIRVDLDEGEFMIVRIGDEVFVTDAWCTHQRSDLSMGVVEGKNVRCALHQATFRLDNGEVLEGPHGEDPSSIPKLKVYKPLVEEGSIYVEL